LFAKKKISSLVLLTNWWNDNLKDFPPELLRGLDVLGITLGLEKETKRLHILYSTQGLFREVTFLNSINSNDNSNRFSSGAAARSHLVRKDFWVREVGENAKHFRINLLVKSHSDWREESYENQELKINT